jgi:hypothetical protein
MADAGIGQQSAIGGYELAFGSKPSLHAITIKGELPASGAGTVFVDGEGKVSVTGTDFTATCDHGAGYITLAAVVAETILGTWTIGTGAHAVSISAGMPDGEDDTELIMAAGNLATTTGDTYAVGIATAGFVSITGIDGGTVSFIMGNAISDADPMAADDGFKLTLMAWAKGGV